MEFGIAGVSLRNLVDFLKAGLQNSNAMVRTSATKAIVNVKLFAGPGEEKYNFLQLFQTYPLICAVGIKDLLGDLNPQLLTTIGNEFDKVEGSSAPEPIRTSADLANVASSSGPGAAKGAAAADPLDDLFPRVELDSLLKGTSIVADAKSDAWKVKKEALEALQAILDQGSNKRLKPGMGECLF
jgi:cytoskeleton-associated protein 5